MLLVLTWIILGFGKEGQVKEEMSHEWHKAGMSMRAETKANTRGPEHIYDLAAKMKAIPMDSIQQKGDIKPMLSGENQIEQERRQPIEVKPGAGDKKPREKVIQTVGKVNYNDKRIVTVVPKIGGRIEDLYIGARGRYVRQGEPLLSIYSAEMIPAQEEYLLALRAKDELSKSPFTEVSRSGESIAESAKRRLKLLHMSDEQIRTLEENRQVQKTLSVYAPESGYFLERQAYKGMDVTPDTVFKLADLSQVWVISDISEYDLPFIRLEQQAVIKPEATPGETLMGKVIDVYPSNPDTHTAKVRFEISNLKGKLKPEMRANVEIKVLFSQKMATPGGLTTTSSSSSVPGTRDFLTDFQDHSAYDKLIAQLSKTYKVDFHLIKAIIRTESGFNPYAVSRKGARGLMQLMPETAQQMNVSNIFDPRQNIEGGIRYFKHLALLFNNDLPLSLAAYNAGEKMVARFKGIPPYPETIDYVKKVMTLYHSYKS